MAACRWLHDRQRDAQPWVPTRVRSLPVRSCTLRVPSMIVRVEFKSEAGSLPRASAETLPIRQHGRIDGSRRRCGVQRRAEGSKKQTSMRRHGVARRSPRAGTVQNGTSRRRRAGKRGSSGYLLHLQLWSRCRVPRQVGQALFVVHETVSPLSSCVPLACPLSRLNHLARLSAGFCGIGGSSVLFVLLDCSLLFWRILRRLSSSFD